MTRARALKQIIRSRAARTGERYTTARRHVLKSIEANAPAARATAAPEPPAVVPSAAPTKGSVSDAMALKKTGQGLEQWFAVLDRFGAVDKGHTASARHLHDEHGVDGWYAQGITVSYERARGLRAVHQRMNGEFEVSVTKTVSASTNAVVRAFSDRKRRQQWIAGADPELAAALTAALQSASSRGVVVRPDGQGRYRYQWGSTRVAVQLLPKGENRTSVVITHMKLADSSAVEVRRRQWRTALAALARTLGD